jgi:hypothetical protein
MTSTLEIISFAASQSFIDNPEVLKPALDTLRAAKPVGYGDHFAINMPLVPTRIDSIYGGIQFEDKKTGYLAIGVY